MRKTSLTFLFFLWTAQAEVTAPGDASANPYSAYAYGYPAAEVKLLPWQSCLVEICGENLGKQAMEDMRYLGADGQTLVTRNWALLNDMNQLFRENLKAGRNSSEAIVKAWDRNLHIQDPKVLSFIGRMQLFGLLAKYLAASPGDFDPQKAYDFMLSSNESVEIATKIKKIAEQLKEQSGKAYSFLNDDYDFAIQSHSREQIQKQIREATDEVENLTQQAFESLPFPKEEFEKWNGGYGAAFARLRSGEWGRRDVEELAQNLGVARILSAVFKTEVEKVNPFLAKDVIPKNYIDQLRSRMELSREALSDNPSAQNPFILKQKSEVEKCVVIMGSAESLLPKLKEVKKFKEDEKNLRSDFAEKFSSRFSAETADKLKPSLAKTLIKAPLSYEEWRKRLDIEVKQQLKSMRQVTSVKRSPLMDEVAIVGALLSIRRGDSNVEQMMNESIGKICADMAVNPIPDGAFEGRAQFGPLTARQGDQGHYVCRHEYAHVASMEFKNGRVSGVSKKKYDEIRACLKAPYGASDLYVEEDFADAVAYGTGTSAPQSQIFCRTMSAYVPHGFSLKNMLPEDTHSSDLYRILHHRLYNGGIPKVCTEALAAQGEKFKLKKCY